MKRRTLLGCESLNQSFWKGHVVQSCCLQRPERGSRAQDTIQSHESPISPVTRQPKSSSRRAMPECQVCGRILTNLVNSGVCSLFKTTSVASLLAWNTCNIRRKTTLLKPLFVMEPLVQPFKAVGKLCGILFPSSLKIISEFVVWGLF